MSIEPLKYLIQPVVIERDDETGRVTKEMPAEVVTVFTAEDAARAVTEFEAAIAQLQGQGEQHDNGRPDADTARRPSSGRVRQS